jgi:hypothetical protein
MWAAREGQWFHARCQVAYRILDVNPLVGLGLDELAVDEQRRSVHIPGQGAEECARQEAAGDSVGASEGGLVKADGLNPSSATMVEHGWQAVPGRVHPVPMHRVRLLRSVRDLFVICRRYDDWGTLRGPEAAKVVKIA